jgi:hypothetical protein
MLSAGLIINFRGNRKTWTRKDKYGKEGIRKDYY